MPAKIPVIKLSTDIDHVRHFISVFEKAIKQTDKVMRSIGEGLLLSTKEKFLKEQDHTGKAWEPNAPATLESYLRKHSGAVNKKGRLTRKGQKLLGNKKILVDSKTLKQNLLYKTFPLGVRVGAGEPSAKYSAIQQFGGTIKRGKGIVIPARPFLGISKEDGVMIVDKMDNFFRSNWKLGE